MDNMHFKTLITLFIKDVQQDEETDREIADKIADLSGQNENKEPNVLDRLLLERLNSNRDAFSREVSSEVESIMEIYDVNTEDPELLEFDDHTQEIREGYETGVMDCIRLPQGNTVDLHGHPLYGRYVIRDGMVFERNAGPFHHEKRTKRAKKMKPLPAFPIRKVYKDMNDYAEKGLGYDYIDEYQGYGYIYNPNGMWDWYQIGGRWPAMFLVKQDCTEYTIGERSWASSDRYPAPEGYIWVCGARKKDIEWQVMREWKNQRTADEYRKYEEIFRSGQVPDDICGCITEDGIRIFGTMVYQKDQTLEDYIRMHGYPESRKYPFGAHDIVDADIWMCSEDTVIEGDTNLDWESRMERYIDELDDETVLVGVDYHI